MGLCGFNNDYGLDSHSIPSSKELILAITNL